MKFARSNLQNGWILCEYARTGIFHILLGHRKISRMLDTQYSRRLDSLGRLVLPKKLRDELGLEAGTEYTFYKHEFEGKVYLCIEAPGAKSEIEKALELLKQNGYNI